MTGTSASAIPAATELSARLIGMPQTPTAIARPTIKPAKDACQAGRRKIPSITSATAMGTAATRNDRTSDCATGAAACSGCAFVDASEQRGAGLVEFLGGLQVSQRAGALAQIFERDAFSHEGCCIRQARQLVQWRHRVFRAIDASDAPGLARVGHIGGEQARSVEVQERIEELHAERVEVRRMVLRDVPVAKYLAHHRTVLRFRQAVVVAMAWPAAP